MTTMPGLIPAVARHWLADRLDRAALWLMVRAVRLRRGGKA
jgi:hypothetical protein